MKKVIIKTEKLCKSFVMGKTSNNVLRNISLEIYEGDFTIIMGSSGSGKSTLLYSISTMDKPTSGSVTLLGHDLSSLSAKEIARVRKKEISFVFQSMNLLSELNAFENIAYCGYGTDTKENVNKKTQELLKLLELEDSAEKYPSELSGGQQQRIAIGRALVGGAKVIFGDEPTGSLNSSMGNQVLDIFTMLNNDGQSIVMVTHDIKAAARATRLLYLSDGKINGELNLGRYTEGDRRDREQKIFDFLNERNW